MVQSHFREVSLQCWEHRGSRLGTKPPFVCLQEDSTACEVVISVIDELEAAGPPARRTLTLRPSRCPRPCGGIRFILSLPTADLREMCIAVNGDLATFEFTPDGLRRFRQAVNLWKQGQEDFSVHPSRTAQGAKDLDSGEVWFWSLRTDP